VPPPERIGLVGDLGRNALGEAPGGLYRQSSGLGRLGERQRAPLSDDSLPATVDETLAKYDLPASRYLEVTEASCCAAVAWLAHPVDPARTGGRIAIADFGTDSASWSYSAVPVERDQDRPLVHRRFGTTLHARAIVAASSRWRRPGAEVVAGVRAASHTFDPARPGLPVRAGLLFGVPGVMQPS